MQALLQPEMHWQQCTPGLADTGTTPFLHAAAALDTAAGCSGAHVLTTGHRATEAPRTVPYL